MYFIIKRILDIIISFITLIFLFPFFVIISLLIVITSGYPIFFKQKRVGQNWKEFNIYKLRSMVNNAGSLGPGISSNNDIRITKIGRLIRKFKIDELPQFFNVLKGDMSIIGPRPELLKYAKIYKDDYSHILKFKPGISDFASIKYRYESKLLDNVSDVENYYVREILPNKISLYKKYIREHSLKTDLQILFSTIRGLFHE